MADTKISGLSDGAPALATDQVVVARSGANYRLNLSAISGVWVTKTANYTAVSGDKILVDTSGGAFTITLPASPTANDAVMIKTGYSTNATLSLTIGRNSSEIMHLSENMTVNTPNVEFTLVYNATTGWTL